MSDWRPIETADKTITFEHFFPKTNITIRSSDPILARDEDGREFECIWSEGKRDYWFDVENESPVDPVEWKPFVEPLEAT
jgi:hypothetical protein